MGSSGDTLVAEVSEPFAYVIGPSPPISVEGRGPWRPARPQDLASRLPGKFSHPVNIWDLRLPVSVEVGMREIKRTQQQRIPTYRNPRQLAG